jgi:acetyl-CoA carboxylase biotin carboxyl carrier protein
MAAKEPRTSKIPEAYGLADIRVLAKILSQYDLSEVEVERGGQRIRLRRERTGSPSVSVAPPTLAPSVSAAPVVAPSAESAARPSAEAESDACAVITSPFVGTFYRAPAPEAPPFVNVGQTVKKGQVLCIVEAMKLMNEIEAESDCKIVEILGKNGEPVEYGQPLFRGLPLG